MRLLSGSTKYDVMRLGIVTLKSLVLYCHDMFIAPGYKLLYMSRSVNPLMASRMYFGTVIVHILGQYRTRDHYFALQSCLLSIRKLGLSYSKYISLNEIPPLYIL